MTEQFRGMVRLLNERRSMVIKGPKGVGKSAALGALSCLCQQPHIVLSARAPLFPKYVEEVLKKYEYAGK